MTNANHYSNEVQGNDEKQVSFHSKFLIIHPLKNIQWDIIPPDLEQVNTSNNKPHECMPMVLYYNTLSKQNF